MAVKTITILDGIEQYSGENGSIDTWTWPTEKEKQQELYNLIQQEIATIPYLSKVTDIVLNFSARASAYGDGVDDFKILLETFVVNKETGAEEQKDSFALYDTVRENTAVKPLNFWNDDKAKINFSIPKKINHNGENINTYNQWPQSTYFPFVHICSEGYKPGTFFSNPLANSDIISGRFKCCFKDSNLSHLVYKIGYVSIDIYYEEITPFKDITLNYITIPSEAGYISGPLTTTFDTKTSISAVGTNNNYYFNSWIFPAGVYPKSKKELNTSFYALTSKSFIEDLNLSNGTLDIVASFSEGSSFLIDLLYDLGDGISLYEDSNFETKIDNLLIPMVQQGEVITFYVKTEPKYKITDISFSIEPQYFSQDGNKYTFILPNNEEYHGTVMIISIHSEKIESIVYGNKKWKKNIPKKSAAIYLQKKGNGKRFIQENIFYNKKGGT